MDRSDTAGPGMHHATAESVYEGVSPGVIDALRNTYAEIMHLASRPGVTPSVARAWYTHARAVALATHVRVFTGNVSVAAVETHETSDLVLEHYERIQHRLSKLVAKHLQDGHDAEDFVRTVLDCERVNLVTRVENARISQAKGDYAAAGVQLVGWETLTPEVQRRLRRWIRPGRVANALKFSESPPNASGKPPLKPTKARVTSGAAERTALFAWMRDVVQVTADTRRLRSKEVAMIPPEVRVGLGGSGDANLTRVVARFLLADGERQQSVRCLSYLDVEGAGSFGEAIPHKGSKMTSEVFVPYSTIEAGGLVPLVDAMVTAFRDRVGISAALALGLHGTSFVPEHPAAMPPKPRTARKGSG